MRDWQQALIGSGGERLVFLDTDAGHGVVRYATNSRPATEARLATHKRDGMLILAIEPSLGGGSTRLPLQIEFTRADRVLGILHPASWITASESYFPLTETFLLDLVAEDPYWRGGTYRPDLKTTFDAQPIGPAREGNPLVDSQLKE